MKDHDFTRAFDFFVAMLGALKKMRDYSFVISSGFFDIVRSACDELHDVATIIERDGRSVDIACEELENPAFVHDVEGLTVISRLRRAWLADKMLNDAEKEVFYGHIIDGELAIPIRNMMEACLAAVKISKMIKGRPLHEESLEIARMVVDIDDEFDGHDGTYLGPLRIVRLKSLLFARVVLTVAYDSITKQAGTEDNEAYDALGDIQEAIKKVDEYIESYGADFPEDVDAFNEIIDDFRRKD